MGKRVFVRLRLPQPVPPPRFRAAMDAFMGKAFRFAVREALQAHIAQIGFLSGTARGTFLHVSRFVGAGISFPTRIGFYYYHRAGSKRVPKSAGLGASLSTAKSSLQAQKRFTTDFPRYTFEMQTALRYFNIQDQVKWNFSVAFTKTMEDKLREFIRKFGPGLIADLYSTVTRGRGFR